MKFQGALLASLTSTMLHTDKETKILARYFLYVIENIITIQFLNYIDSKLINLEYRRITYEQRYVCMFTLNKLLY